MLGAAEPSKARTPASGVSLLANANAVHGVIGDTAPNKEGRMHAIEFLKHEHQKAKAAFGKVLHASSTERGKLWTELKPELEAHEEIEETCLYGPISQEASDPMLRDWKRRHQEEIKRVDAVIKQVDGLGNDDGRRLEKLNEIHKSLEAHIREEEDEIFPRISRAWDQSRLEQAGTKMEQMHSAQKRRAA